MITPRAGAQRALQVGPTEAQLGLETPSLEAQGARTGAQLRAVGAQGVIGRQHLRLEISRQHAPVQADGRATRATWRLRQGQRRQLHKARRQQMMLLGVRKAVRQAAATAPTGQEQRTRPATPEKLRDVMDLYPPETLRTINPIWTTRARERGRGGCLLTEEPTKFEEANTEECWRRAMDDELGSIRNNNT
jgi:hypothetical protein